MSAMTRVDRAGEAESDPVDPSDDWVVRLSVPGPTRDEAIALLHALLVRAARHQVGRMAEAHQLGEARREEIVHATADAATVSVLARVGAFEGRSRFTTWAYKFGILQAAVEVRRASWRTREIDLYSIPEPVSTAMSPEDFTEASDLTHAVRRSIEADLTPHQRRVVLSLLVDGVPIDVLAERLSTTRNALYKTLHDARKRLRGSLVAQGLINTVETRKATP